MMYREFSYVSRKLVRLTKLLGIHLLLLITTPWWIDAVAEDKPDVAAAVARVEALGGNVQRLGRPGDDGVTAVVLIGSEKVRDDDLVVLRAFPDLERLMLGGTAITDAGLEHAAELHELTTLGLIGTKVTDAGMKELAGLNKLEHVRLANTAVTDVGVRELSRHKSLQILILSNNRITDDALADLGTLPNLRELDLSFTSITDDGLKQLEQLNNLDALSLRETQISDRGLKSIGKLTSLTRLDMSGSKITDTGLAELEALPKLTQLAANNTAITDAGLAQLQKLKSIRTVLLAGTHTTQAGLDAIKKFLPQARLSQTADAGGGQRSDPDFDTSVEHPAYVEKHPTVLFDEAHDNFHTASGRYKPLADLISSDGYQVIPNKEAITSERLAGRDLLIIANAVAQGGQGKSAFTADECDSIQKWVEAGGALLLITDHEPFGSASEELGKRFGVGMSLHVTVDPANEKEGALLFSRDKGQLGDHPIMIGRDESERVDRVLTFVGQSLLGPTGSMALLKFADSASEDHGGQQVSAAGRAQGVALKFGRGRVVVMGEAGQLSAQIVGDPPEKFGMNRKDCDNRKMVLNLMHWLSGLLD